MCSCSAVSLQVPVLWLKVGSTQVRCYRVKQWILLKHQKLSFSRNLQKDPPCLRSAFSPHSSEQWLTMHTSIRIDLSEARCAPAKTAPQYNVLSCFTAGATSSGPESRIDLLNCWATQYQRSPAGCHCIRRYRKPNTVCFPVVTDSRIMQLTLVRAVELPLES